MPLFTLRKNPGKENDFLFFLIPINLYKNIIPVISNISNLQLNKNEFY
ncbi:protein of unknown function [Ruminococcaceae bacterium BL-6]|nr:protein of unknown function [Ruminococcaceae bacterium BL-6]